MIVTKARTKEGLVKAINDVLDQINKWMRDIEVQLAPEKTESLLPIGRKKHGRIISQLKDYEIVPKDYIK